MLDSTMSGLSITMFCLKLFLVLPFSFQPYPSPHLGFPVTQRKAWWRWINAASLEGKDPKGKSGMNCSGLTNHQGFSMEHLKLYLLTTPNCSSNL